MPAVALAIGGPVAVAAAWLVIRSGRSLWLVNGLALPALGLLAVATGVVVLVGDGFGGLPFALLVGLGSGVVLYLATAAFMVVAGGWSPLARHTRELYETNRDTIPVPAAVAISALAVAPGEELLWRGVVLHSLVAWLGPSPLAPALAWVAYVAANAFSGSIPILLGAIVGGGAWTILAVVTGGVAASIACHAVWTTLMILRPPVRAAS